MLRSNRPVPSSSTALGRHAGSSPLFSPSLPPRAACPPLGRCLSLRGVSTLSRNRLTRRGTRIFVFTPTRPMERTLQSEPAKEPPPNLPYRLAAEQQLRKWLGLRPGDALNVVTEVAPVRGTPTQLYSAVTRVTTADQQQHAFICMVLPLPARADGTAATTTTTSSDSQVEGRSGSNLEVWLPTLGLDQQQWGEVLLHWGCSSGQGQRWRGPPHGWNTFPDRSSDGGGGAWQTPMQLCQCGGGDVLITLLQLPLSGVLSSGGGMSFILKAGPSHWLQNADSNNDFHLPLSDLPETLLPDAAPPPSASAAAAAAGGDAGDEERAGWFEQLEQQGPPGPLAWDRVKAAVQKSHKKPHWQNNHQHQQQGQKNDDHDSRKQSNGKGSGGHWQEKQQQLKQHKEGKKAVNREAPTDFGGLAGRRAPEPAKDHTQVCTLSSDQLHASSELQLQAWLSQQDDLRHEEGATFTVRHCDFPLPGHPSTPFVLTTTTATTTSGTPLLLLVGLADGGVTGRLVKGLVFSHTCTATNPLLAAAAGTTAVTSSSSSSSSSSSGAKAGANAGASGSRGSTGSGVPALPGRQVLPWGWSSTPKLGWDAGEGWWETPFSQTLLNPAASPPASDNGVYMVALRIPLVEPLVSGSLMFQLRTARGHRLRNPDTSTPFVLPISLLTSPDPPMAVPANNSSSSSNRTQQQQQGCIATRAAASLGEMMAVAGIADREMQEVQQALAALAARDAAAAAAARASREATAAGAGVSNGSLSSGLGLGFEARSPSDGKRAAGLKAAIRDFQRDPSDPWLHLWGSMTPGDHTMPAGFNTSSSSAAGGVEGFDAGVFEGFARDIANKEPHAERSLMHRYNTAADIIQGLPRPQEQQQVVLGQGLAGLVAVGVWLCFSAARFLRWNHNYNIKPREISAALDRLGQVLVEWYESAPAVRGEVLLALAAAGRGGEGDLGQRIRDEILVIQSRNNCKGGMMEQWHQKLHNNSSPDDIAICQALLAQLDHPALSPEAYWDSLNRAGITRERLASFDRSITHEPSFVPEQVSGLKEDLRAYLVTLQAVHGGDDLASAAKAVLGYEAPARKGKAVKVLPVPGLACQQLQPLIDALLHMQHITSSSSRGSSSLVTGLMLVDRAVRELQLVGAAQRILLPALRGGNAACGGRLKDVLFLDLALQRVGRTTLESSLGAMRAAAPSMLLGGVLAAVVAAVEVGLGAAMPGSRGNAEPVACMALLEKLATDEDLSPRDKALQVLSVFERLRNWLAATSATAADLLSPAASTLARTLGLSKEQVEGEMFAEEVVRGSTLAALAQLLPALETRLYSLAGVSPWTILSRGGTSAVQGELVAVATLAEVQATAYTTATILLVSHVGGEEEIPPGVVGLIIAGGSCPDVLCHSAVRARNGGVHMVGTREEAERVMLLPYIGQQVVLKVKGEDVAVAPAPASSSSGSSSGGGGAGPAGASQQQQLQQVKPWSGQWLLSPGDYTVDQVGAKAMATATLQKLLQPTSAATASANATALPPWLHSPASVSLPYGVFEAVLAASENSRIKSQIEQQLMKVMTDDHQQQLAAAVTADDCQGIKELVLQLQPPGELKQQLQQAMKQLLLQQQQQGSVNSALDMSSNGSSRSDDDADGSVVWEEIWGAVKGVWASQWNPRAQLALSKAQLSAMSLHMAVLLQPVVPVSYAWVAHTLNPVNGSADEVYVEMVVGLGEVLVGSYPGRSLGGVVGKAALKAALQQQREQQQGSAPLAMGGGDRGAMLSPAAPPMEVLKEVVRVVSYPSKALGLKAPGVVALPGEMGVAPSSSTAAAAGRSGGVKSTAIMARSDSNAEDLPGFAGAGLFDSIPSVPPTAVLIDYNRDPLVSDQTARLQLLWQVAAAAVAVEEGMGGMHQDVEGGVTEDGRVWVLQARPQV